MTQNYDKRDNTSPESSDRREDVVETEDAEDETELIFQNYLRRQSGFRRTTPSQQTEPFKRKDFHCDQCDFTSNTLQCLRDHIQNTHGSSNRIRATREKIIYSHFWNNKGSCDYESRFGRPCKFVHKKAPFCHFDGQCRKEKCM